jgi:hypothetical protein
MKAMTALAAYKMKLRKPHATTASQVLQKAKQKQKNARCKAKEGKQFGSGRV